MRVVLRLILVVLLFRNGAPAYQRVPALRTRFRQLEIGAALIEIGGRFIGRGAGLIERSTRLPDLLIDFGNIDFRQRLPART